jgi:hypothetical protein
VIDPHQFANLKTDLEPFAYCHFDVLCTGYSRNCWKTKFAQCLSTNEDYFQSSDGLRGKGMWRMIDLKFPHNRPLKKSSPTIVKKSPRVRVELIKPVQLLAPGIDLKRSRKEKLAHRLAFANQYCTVIRKSIHPPGNLQRNVKAAPTFDSCQMSFRLPYTFNKTMSVQYKTHPMEAIHTKSPQLDASLIEMAVLLIRLGESL